MWRRTLARPWVSQSWTLARLWAGVAAEARACYHNQRFLPGVSLGISPKSACSTKGTPSNFTRNSVFCKRYPSEFHPNQHILQGVWFENSTKSKYSARGNPLDFHQNQHLLQGVPLGISPKLTYSARGIPRNFTKLNVFYKRFLWNFTNINIFCKRYPSELHQNQRIL